MFKFIFVLFSILAFVGFALSNLLTVEVLDALAPMFNDTSADNTTL
jgi:hypothetical protein